MRPCRAGDPPRRTLSSDPAPGAIPRGAASRPRQRDVGTRARSTDAGDQFGPAFPRCVGNVCSREDAGTSSRKPTPACWRAPRMVRHETISATSWARCATPSSPSAGRRAGVPRRRTPNSRNSTSQSLAPTASRRLRRRRARFHPRSRLCRPSSRHARGHDIAGLSTASRERGSTYPSRRSTSRLYRARNRVCEVALPSIVDPAQPNNEESDRHDVSQHGVPQRPKGHFTSSSRSSLAALAGFSPRGATAKNNAVDG